MARKLNKKFVAAAVVTATVGAGGVGALWYLKHPSVANLEARGDKAWAANDYKMAVNYYGRAAQHAGNDIPLQVKLIDAYEYVVQGDREMYRNLRQIMAAALSNDPRSVPVLQRMIVHERNDVHADVVVASVQTLSQPHRLDRLVDPEPTLLGVPDPFTTVVVDEAHHSTAPTYVAVLTAVRAGEPDGPLLVGVTATPDRGDRRGLDDVYDEVVAHYDTLWGIRNGYLCDVRAVQVAVSGTPAAAAAMFVAAWNEHGAGRPTLVFAPTVALAHWYAAAFMDDGTAAVAVDQTTPMTERMALIRQLERGELHVLVNCEVFTEGTDIPCVACIGMARSWRPSSTTWGPTPISISSRGALGWCRTACPILRRSRSP